MVEFAIAASVLVVLLLGILEFGLAAWARNCVVADAREGARYAMVRGSTSGRTADSAMVADFVKSKTSLDNSIQVVTTWGGAKAAGTTVTVKVRHVVPRRGPFRGEHTDSSSSTMVVLF